MTLSAVAVSPQHARLAIDWFVPRFWLNRNVGTPPHHRRTRIVIGLQLATLQRRRSRWDPAWTEESGHRILREPDKGDPVGSQAVFRLHRHRFGQSAARCLMERGRSLDYDR